MTSPSDVPQVERRADGGTPKPPEGPPTRSEKAIHVFGIASYSLCGASATATPLVLWMSWSPEVYGLVLLNGFVSCCGIVFLSKFLPEYRGGGRRDRDRP